jgi:peptidoglycan hydrolase CwlO-like protein
MKFDEFLSWGFTGLISGILIYGVKVLQDIKSSVEELNERMATIIEKTSWHEKEMERLNGKIEMIELRIMKKETNL